jgi:glycosyltransferase involved in cell wall biosynthesis
MPSFRLNTVGDQNGPAIFGKRLKKGLESRGWRYNEKSPDINFVFASGEYVPGAVNILRLDNLYFDKDNTIGDTDKLNKKIKTAYRKFDKLIFQSFFGKNQYFNHFGKVKTSYRIIYNGVPKSFSTNGDRYNYPFEKVFICSSDWRVHKRLEPIINAFKSFPGSDKGLVILGNCKDKVKRKNILYLGKVHHTKLPYYLRGADAAIHISWLDCSPNVIYEFLGCGLPVLCSHNGGTKEIVRDNGITLRLEKDYKFNKVRLYHPPEPDLELIHWGMLEILKKEKVTDRPDVYMRRVVDEYIDFAIN